MKTTYYGSLRVYVVVYPPSGKISGRPKMIYQEHGLTLEEATERSREFRQANPNLPIFRASWQMREEDLS